MSERERCDSCGAGVPAETGVCAYCGTAVEHDANVPPPTRDRASEKIERFDRLAEHPTFDRWMRWRPAQTATSADGTTGTGVVFIVLGAGLGLYWLASSGGFVGAWPVALVLIFVGVKFFVRGSARQGSPASPTKPYAALVVTKRTEVTTGQYARTRYFVTLEFRSGARREYDVDGGFYGLVADDDIGVAYIREGELLSFKKMDV